MMRVTLGRRARLEAIEAAEWYEKQDEGLGDRFLKELQAAQHRVSLNPEMYRCFRGDMRKCRFEVFPYLLIYKISGDVAKVAAVMHTSRKPNYWEH
jgi:plasmid stabilization system protein ParE